MSGFIAVHTGAGTYSPAKESGYRLLCEKACQLGMKLIKSGARCWEVVEEIVSYLEDSHLTNAGCGSNLNVEGTVECDAAVMTSDSSRFAAVGCLRLLRNPIKLACKILDEQLRPEILGLVRPLCIVGDGALEKARQLGFHVTSDSSLVSPESLRQYRKYKRMLDEANQDLAEPQAKKARKCSDLIVKVDSVNPPDECGSGQGSCLAGHNKLDTVGVVVMDSCLKLAAGVSSGGILLKQPGRLGHSCHFGCGCWALDYKDEISVAACTSGCGEHIIKTNLARSCSDNAASGLRNDSFNIGQFLIDNFLNSPLLHNVEEKLCGILLMRCDLSASLIELFAAHSTESFCFGFMSESCAKPKVCLSRLPDKKSTGRTVLTNAYLLRIK